MLFEISDKIQLSKLLAVAPDEIDHVLRRVNQYYRPANVPKRDGSRRMLLVPHGELKALQKKIKTHILDKFPFLECVHGGIRHRSIVSNATPHIGKAVVFSVDLKDFFPHITPARVSQIFRGLGFGEECVGILAKATTWKYQLPQGAPTSTGLANLSVVRADWRLQRLAELQCFSYTRYIDDLTLSGGWRLLKFRGLIPRIVESEGFIVKPEKTVTMPMGRRQSVTRLVVNTKLNMPREWRQDVRREVIRQARGESSLSSVSILGRVNWFYYLNSESAGKLLDQVRSE
jgi:RNA-directed DNA polymerase